ncbi:MULTISPECIES: type II toxin-antitoxin system VapC family toxin [Rhizobium]|jgi:tRNA(fMet)-specific endonuclease VapC|uniref:Ribonuclease VapC n=2 Tax=Rhizobium TaxID=379 RepID=A0A9Q3QYZ9_9HYPH|nr:MULTISPECIES: type II toxin-antitoxin system VapC family toxin [Rhizobium]MBB3137639.1 tRNA(fMet)-specific endonuclease VapC [Rhizobium pisi]MBX4899060.1 type II toxin-antitoxin system VapC family toxin [Rhizobium bangladeshense]MBX4957924.1 type II toxin-antitoxin system VapC family toxin [Rhizobium lentis]MBX4968900.1 type II toxin-antitoxin system VapC family toxin [Rhizobium binae]MBX4975855.1 type II toxin-antitoxin system VapC family toxin [Rhizobium lentis]
MARYMLDTNMCIYLMKNQPEQVARRFASCYVGDVVMSAITFAELEYGVSASDDPERELDNLTALAELITVEPFGIAAARAYGPVRMATRDRKKDHLDKLIASHAIALDTVLVTNNTRDFLAYPGLKLENWLDAERRETN